MDDDNNIKGKKVIFLEESCYHGKYGIFKNILDSNHTDNLMCEILVEGLERQNHSFDSRFFKFADLEIQEVWENYSKILIAEKFKKSKQKIARYTLTATVDLIIPEPLTPKTNKLIEDFLTLLKSDPTSFINKELDVQPTITYKIMENDEKGNVSKISRIVKDSGVNNCGVKY